jgi:hypothetical protein
MAPGAWLFSGMGVCRAVVLPGSRPEVGQANLAYRSTSARRDGISIKLPRAGDALPPDEPSTSLANFWFLVELEASWC